MNREGQFSRHSWFPVVSWEVESCGGMRALRLWRVILHGEAGSGMLSHLREAGLTRLWWIQIAISVTLAIVATKKTTKGPL
jgi:hypothetical protein